MFKENGRLNVSIAGVVSSVNKETELSYVVVDNEKVYIQGSSNKLFAKIISGEYVNLECYIDNGKVFATGVK